MTSENQQPPPDEARQDKRRATAFGRRPFIAASLVATAGLAAIPVVKTIDKWADRPGAGTPTKWDPGAIPGLDLHFDARRMNVYPIDSTDFTAGQPWTSARGMTWSRTNRLQASASGLQMTTGADSAALIQTSPVPHFCLRMGVMAGAAKTGICVTLLDTADNKREIRLSQSATRQSTDLRGFPPSRAAHSRPRSNLVAGKANTIEIRLAPSRTEVVVNKRTVIAVDNNDRWQVRGYGVGFYDGDTESTIQNVVVGDSTPREVRTGEPVALLPQLAQPSRCLAARQSHDSQAPVLGDNSIGKHAGLYFDGSRSLTTNAALDVASFTIVAVVKGAGSSGGTIIGPNPPPSEDQTGGVQLRVDPDGSLVALLPNQLELARSQPGTVGDAPAIIAFSLDSAGNSALYVNARPVAGRSAPVTLEPGLTMAIGASHGGEYYTGDICEVLRWTRPLGGQELRTVFDNVSAGWDIEVSHPVAAPVRTLPEGLRVKGSNVIPSHQDLSDPSGSAWLSLWSRWDWGWIELSIRRAVDQGANTVRLIGDVNAVYTGAIDEATYLGRLQQVIDLCKSLSIQLYYCAIDLRHKRGADPAFIRGFLSHVAALLERNRSNVVAIELCNEVASGYQLFPQDQVVEWITSWGKAIRAAAPSIPLSISDVSPGSLNDKICGADYYARFADLVDFFDLHVYDGLRTSPDSAILAPYELAVDRPLLIGEFGVDRTAPGAAPGAFYSQVKTLRESSSLVFGAVQWGAVNDQWGLYSESDGQLQPEVAEAWARF